MVRQRAADIVAVRVRRTLGARIRDVALQVQSFRELHGGKWSHRKGLGRKLVSTIPHRLRQSTKHSPEKSPDVETQKSGQTCSSVTVFNGVGRERATSDFFTLTTLILPVVIDRRVECWQR